MNGTLVVNVLLGLSIIGLIVLIVYLVKKYYKTLEGFFQQSNTATIDIDTYMSSVSQPIPQTGAPQDRDRLVCPQGYQLRGEKCYQPCPRGFIGVENSCVPTSTPMPTVRAGDTVPRCPAGFEFDAKGPRDPECTTDGANNTTMCAGCTKAEGVTTCIPPPAQPTCFPMCKDKMKGVGSKCLKAESIAQKIGFATISYSCPPASNIQTRYIRIEGSRYMALSLVMAIDENGDNVAEGKSVTASDGKNACDQTGNYNGSSDTGRWHGDVYLWGEKNACYTRYDDIGGYDKLAEDKPAGYNQAWKTYTNPVKPGNRASGGERDATKIYYANDDVTLPFWELDLGREYNLQSVTVLGANNVDKKYIEGKFVMLMTGERKVNYRLPLTNQYVHNWRLYDAGAPTYKAVNRVNELSYASVQASDSTIPNGTTLTKFILINGKPGEIALNGIEVYVRNAAGTPEKLDILPAYISTSGTALVDSTIQSAVSNTPLVGGVPNPYYIQCPLLTNFDSAASNFTGFNNITLRGAFTLTTYADLNRDASLNIPSSTVINRREYHSLSSVLTTPVDGCDCRLETMSLIQSSWWKMVGGWNNYVWAKYLGQALDASLNRNSYIESKQVRICQDVASRMQPVPIRVNAPIATNLANIVVGDKSDTYTRQYYTSVDTFAKNQPSTYTATSVVNEVHSSWGKLTVPWILITLPEAKQIDSVKIINRPDKRQQMDGFTIRLWSEQRVLIWSAPLTAAPIQDLRLTGNTTIEHNTCTTLCPPGFSSQATKVSDPQTGIEYTSDIQCRWMFGGTEAENERLSFRKHFSSRKETYTCQMNQIYDTKRYDTIEQANADSKCSPGTAARHGQAYYDPNYNPASPSTPTEDIQYLIDQDTYMYCPIRANEELELYRDVLPVPTSGTCPANYVKEYLKDAEVFHVGTWPYETTKEQAEGVCAAYGARVATKLELREALDNGASWCSCGWTRESRSDATISSTAFYPNNLVTANERTGNCGTYGATPLAGIRDCQGNPRNGVNCFGIKPPKGRDAKILNFAGNTYYAQKRNEIRRDAFHMCVGKTLADRRVEERRGTTDSGDVEPVDYAFNLRCALPCPDNFVTNPLTRDCEAGPQLQTYVRSNGNQNFNCKDAAHKYVPNLKRCFADCPNNGVTLGKYCYPQGTTITSAGQGVDPTYVPLSCPAFTQLRSDNLCYPICPNDMIGVPGLCLPKFTDANQYGGNASITLPNLVWLERAISNIEIYKRHTGVSVNAFKATNDPPPTIIYNANLPESERFKPALPTGTAPIKQDNQNYYLFEGMAKRGVGSPVNLRYDWFNPASAPVVSGDLNEAIPDYAADPERNYKAIVYGPVKTNEGTVQTELAQALGLAERVYLGSPNDIDKFLMVSWDDTKPYIRKEGVKEFFFPEAIQVFDTTNQMNQGFKIIQNPKATNNTSRRMELTPAVFANFTAPARNFIKAWVSSRTSRMIRERYGPIETADQVIQRLTSVPPLEVPSTVQLDIKKKSMLNDLAQTFYQYTNGKFIMTYIYDVFTLGTSMVDIRFDMTQHEDADYGANKEPEKRLGTKMNVLNRLYTGVLDASGMTQDVVDEARGGYTSTMADLQLAQAESVRDPQQGVVGRFFYTVNPNSQKIMFNGFTLDKKVVTTFLRGLNCGIEVPIGTEPGNVNYSPITRYTNNAAPPLVCSDIRTIRRIMSDYTEAATTPEFGLQHPLGDISGTLYITEITHSKQINDLPYQCAYGWKETVFDQMTNAPVTKPEQVNQQRYAIFTYNPNEEDWYANERVFDLSGFKFLTGPSVPECKWNAQDYINNVGKRLVASTADDAIKDYRLIGMRENRSPCPSVNPGYVLNPSVYSQANPSLPQSFTKDGVTTTKDSDPGNYYLAVIKDFFEGRDPPVTGPLKNLNRVLSPAFTIPAVTRQIRLHRPLPAEDTLTTDDNDLCQPKKCDDPDLLYDLMEDYNADPDQPGMIMRILKAVTPSSNSCQIQAQVNWDAEINDAAAVGGVRRKGSAKAISELPNGSTGIKVSTFEFGVSLDGSDCSYILETVGINGGVNIQENTPALPAPVEFASEAAKRQKEDLAELAGEVTSVANQVLNRARVAGTNYRIGTYSALGDLQGLVGCPTSTCNSGHVKTLLLSYLKMIEPNAVSITNTKTLSPTTCQVEYTSTNSSTSKLTNLLLETTSPCIFRVTGRQLIEGADIQAYNTWNKVSNLQNVTDMNVVKYTQKPLPSMLKEPFVSAMPRPAASQGAPPMAPPIQELRALDTHAFGRDSGRNMQQGFGLTDMYTLPLANSAGRPARRGVAPPIVPTPLTPFETAMRNQTLATRAAPLYAKPAEVGIAAAAGEDARVAAKDQAAYKFLRFRPVSTRVPTAEAVGVWRFSFFYRGTELAINQAKVTNPMGDWTGGVGDVTGTGGKGFRDVYKKALVFAFPQPILVDGFSFTTARGVRSAAEDPVTWKMEGSHNGTFWQVLHEQSVPFPVPAKRGEDLPMFRLI